MNSEKEITLHLDYPQNLILAVVQNSNLIPPEKYTDDICAGIRYVVSTLGYREQDILRMRFEERKPRSEIGEFFGIGQERVRQIENKTLRSLWAPTRWNYMKLGIDGYMRWTKERARGEGYKTGYDQGYNDGYEDGKNGVEKPVISEELLNHPIDSMGLSVRAFNCLLRARCERVGDVVRMSEYQIQTLRNLGAKSANEIACALRDMGISNTNWASYIL